MAGSSLNLDAGIATAGLDAVSGVFGYLAAQENASVANSRADLVRTEALAHADRYALYAAQAEAHEKVMYLASGVKLAGSPVDDLAFAANIAQQNISAILMGGEEKAMDEQVAGVNDKIKGDDALLKSVNLGMGAFAKGYGASLPATKDATGLGIIADMLTTAGKQ